MLFQEQIKMVKQAAPELAATTNEQRNAALAAVRAALLQHQEEIFEANRQDMEQAETPSASASSISCRFLRQIGRIWSRRRQMVSPVRSGNG